MSPSSSEFQAQFSRLFKLAAAMAAVISLVYFWRGDFVHVGKTLFFFIFHGSAAMLGSVLALGIGWRHYAFWSRAKWDGSIFRDETHHVLLLRTFDWLCIAGGAVLLTSLISQLHQGRRGLLDHVLGILSWLVISVIASHKARMDDVRHLRTAEGAGCAEITTQAMFAAAVMAPAAQAVYYGPGCHALEAAFWGAVIAVGCYVLMRKLRLPEVGDGTASSPADVKATGPAGDLVGA